MKHRWDTSGGRLKRVRVEEPSKFIIGVPRLPRKIEAVYRRCEACGSLRSKRLED